MLAYWALMLVAAIASGCACCASLVATQRAVPFMVVLATLAGAAGVAAVVGLGRATGRADLVIAAAFIGVGGFIGGFALAAALVPAITKPAPLPGPVPSIAHRTDPPIAFVLVAEGQPEEYDPATLTRAHEMLVMSDVPAPPDAVRVFAYLSERVRYRHAGLSPSRPVVRAVNDRMAASLSDQGFTGPVAEAWIHGTPRLADTVFDLASSGSREIVVVYLSVAGSVPFDRARMEVERIVPPTSRVRVCYAHALWADDALARLVAGKVLAALPQGPRPTDGVVLAGAGQPWQWDRENPGSCEHETYFLQRVRAALVAAGATEANVRTAWLDWQDPGVTEVARHLAALGCERIVVTPATVCADTLETVIDLPSAVDAADLDPGIRVEILHGWGDEPAVADALARAAISTARECER